MPAKFEVPSFNSFGIISTYFPKNRDHVTLTTPAHFRKFLRGHIQCFPGNMLAKFEACSFECVGSRQRSSVPLQTRVCRPEIDRDQSLI